jgi:hypothetical protein
MTSNYEYMGKTIDYTIAHLMRLKERYEQKDSVLTLSAIELLQSDMKLIKCQYEQVKDEFN